jgi:hypothetical protein
VGGRKRRVRKLAVSCNLVFLKTYLTINFIDEVANWRSDPAPPKISVEVIALVTDLSSISSELNERQLDTFISTLLSGGHTLASIKNGMNIGDILQNCHKAEISSALHDFCHMLVLVQAAFWIERCVIFSIR